jgi:hypothetical protein
LAALSHNSDLIYRALSAAIEPLGERGKRALFEDLESNGVNLKGTTLIDLRRGLQEVLGGESADLLIEQVLLWLDQLESK